MTMPRLRRISRGNVIAQAAEEIRRLVVGNGLPDGHKLPSEHALCRQLGVGRSSVREALRVLQAVGLIETIQGKGAFVHTVRPPSVPQRYSARILQEAGPIVIQMRAILERRCAELAAARAGGHEIRALQIELVKLREALAVKDLEGAVEADSRFHLVLARAARNDVLFDILQGMDPVATANRRRALGFYTDGRFLDLHAKVFDAVRRHDPRGAAAAMERHMRAIRNVETVLAKA